MWLKIILKCVLQRFYVSEWRVLNLLASSYTKSQNLASGHQQVLQLPWSCITEGCKKGVWDWICFNPQKSWGVKRIPCSFFLNLRFRAHKGLTSSSPSSLTWPMEKPRPREGKGTQYVKNTVKTGTLVFRSPVQHSFHFVDLSLSPKTRKQRKILINSCLNSILRERYKFLAKDMFIELFILSTVLATAEDKADTKPSLSIAYWWSRW